MNEERECRVLTRYLVGKDPTPKTFELYTAVAHSSVIILAGKESRTWNKCIRHPFLLPFVDAALAWRKPRSGLRKKLFQHMAIIESIPDYSRFFLPRHRSLLYVFVFMGRSFAAFFKALAGSVLLLFL